MCTPAILIPEKITSQSIINVWLCTAATVSSVYNFSQDSSYTVGLGTPHLALRTDCPNNTVSRVLLRGEVAHTTTLLAAHCGACYRWLGATW